MPRRRGATGWAPRAGLDVTAVFTGYLVFLLAIPATMVVKSLGTMGAPATMLSLLALAWYMWHHLHRTEPVGGGASPVRQSAIVFIAVSLIVYGHAMTTFIPGLEQTNADASMLRALGMMGIVLVVTDGITSVDRWRALMRRMGIAGALVACVAIAQFFTHQMWIDRLSIPGLTPPVVAEVGERGMFTRPSATATNAIELGAVLSMFLPMAFTVAQTSRRHRLLAWVPVGLMGFAALVSLSRTAIICVAIGMAVLVPAWSRRAKLQLVALAPFALMGVGAAVPGLLGTLRGLFTGAGNDSSVASRTNSYAVAFAYIERHPFLGRGYGTFLPNYWILDNAWLQLVIGTGFIGTAAFAWLVLEAVRSARTAEREFQQQGRIDGTGNTNALLARSVMAGVCAGAVSLFFFDGLSFPQSAGAVMMMLGLAGASLRLARHGGTTPGGMPEGTTGHPALPERP